MAVTILMAPAPHPSLLPPLHGEVAGMAWALNQEKLMVQAITGRVTTPSQITALLTYFLRLH